MSHMYNIFLFSFILIEEQYTISDQYLNGEGICCNILIYVGIQCIIYIYYILDKIVKVTSIPLNNDAKKQNV